MGGPVPADVKVQQEKVAWADAFAFVCPVFWMNLPANMIGWIVRVFSYGFAYKLNDEGWKGHVVRPDRAVKAEKSPGDESNLFLGKGLRGFRHAGRDGKTDMPVRL